LRPAAFFCAEVPPCFELLRDDELPDFLPPRLDEPGEFELGWLLTLAAGWYSWMLVQGWHVGVDLHESQVRSEPTLQEARARRAS
jgi:hypothetical protein